LESQVEVLQTAAMVGNDYKRTFVAAFGPCIGSVLAKGVKGLKVLRSGQITFPKDAPLIYAFRVLFTTPMSNRTEIERAFDLVAMGNGRFEASISSTAALGTAAKDVDNGLNAMAVIEQSLARLVAKRIGVKAVA